MFPGVREFKALDIPFLTPTRDWHSDASVESTPFTRETPVWHFFAAILRNEVFTC